VRIKFGPKEKTGLPSALPSANKLQMLKQIVRMSKADYESMISKVDFQNQSIGAPLVN
jgi:hypothetical protein